MLKMTDNILPSKHISLPLITKDIISTYTFLKSNNDYIKYQPVLFLIHLCVLCTDLGI